MEDQKKDSKQSVSHKEHSKKKSCFRFTPHQFVQTGRGPPVLVTELRTCLAVSREAEKRSRWPFSLFLVRFAFRKVENIRQGLKFLFHPSKRKVDLKQGNSKAGDYFDSKTLFQRQNWTERPDFVRSSPLRHAELLL